MRTLFLFILLSAGAVLTGGVVVGGAGLRGARAGVGHLIDPVLADLAGQPIAGETKRVSLDSVRVGADLRDERDQHEREGSAAHLVCDVEWPKEI